MNHKKKSEEKMKHNKIKLVVIIGVLCLFINPIRLALGTPGNNAEEDTTFIVNVSGIMNVHSLDPHMVVGGDSIIDQVCEGLLLYNSTVLSNVRLEPQLATNNSWINLTTWEFTLRENVNFHDGTPFNATAAKWNIDRCVHMNLNYAGPIRDAFELEADGYKTIYDHLDWAADGSKISMINRTIVVDEFTLQINFNVPLAAEDIIPLPIFNIISPTAHADQFDEIMETDKLIGTGPFIFTGIDFGGNEIVLDRNNDYWRGPAYISQKLALPKLL